MSEVVTITEADAAWPRQLRGLKGMPRALYVRGDVSALSATAVSIVGTREASRAGLAIARRIATDCAGADVVVVSGLARGIDAAAHEATLAAGGVTVAVLAHGLDMVYPHEHTELARRIVEGGGALVSEHPEGTAPERWHFATRNRIQAALGRASVVVETTATGGTMHHARYAASFGRRIIVPMPDDPRGLVVQGGRVLVEELLAVAVADRAAAWAAIEAAICAFTVP